MILAVMALLGGCAHRPGATPRAIALDELLAFAEPSRCEAAPVHTNLLGAMIAGDANVGFRPGRVVAPSPQSSAFGNVYLHPYDAHTVIGVPVRGTVFGLALVAIEQSLPEGGDPGETHYRFKAEPAFVERVLAGRGFPVKLGQTVVIGPPDGYEQFIALTVDQVYPGHTLLSCGYQ